MDLLRREVPATLLVVAVDPGKAFNRVWLTTGERGLIGEPVSLPVLREGVDELARRIDASGISGQPVIGLEETGGLHRAWAVAIERRWPGSLRLFAPSETTAARGQLGSRRFKTDDRRRDGLAAAPGRRAPGRARQRRGDVGNRSPSSSARRRALQAAAAPARSAQRALPGAVGAARARPGPGRRVADRASGSGMRGGLCWPAAVGEVVAGPRAGPTNRRDSRVLVGALEAAVGASAGQ